MTSSSEQTTALIAEVHRRHGPSVIDPKVCRFCYWAWPCESQQLSDALAGAVKDLHEVGRLAGQIMFDSDAEPARAAILDVTRKYGNAPTTAGGY